MRRDLFRTMHFHRQAIIFKKKSGRTNQKGKAILDQPFQRFFALFAYAIAMVLAQSAWAQTSGGGGGSAINMSPPAETYAVSPGGVDIRTGRYALNSTDLTIGGGQEGNGLSFSRILSTYIQGHADPFGNFSHNWDIFIIQRQIDLDNPSYIASQSGDWNPDGFELKIVSGGRSETFHSTQFSFVRQSRGPAKTLTVSNGIHTYQASDGSITVFRPLTTTECSNIANRQCAFASHIVFPNGTRIDFEYETTAVSTVPNKTRLKRVISSLGYVLLLNYSGTGANWNFVTKACVLNIADVAAPASGICPSNADNTASYSAVNFEGRIMTGSFTNALGQTSNYSYARTVAGTATTNGQYTMSFYQSGQSTPWLINTISEQRAANGTYEDIVTGQSFADGQSYSYGYWRPIYPAAGPSDPPAISGGSYSDANGNTVAALHDFPVLPLQHQGGSTHEITPIELGDIRYQTTPGPVTVTDQIGRITTYDYCDPVAAAALPPEEGNRCFVDWLYSVTTPEGQRTEYTYDSSKNITQIRAKTVAASNGSIYGAVHPDDIVSQAEYNCLNPKFCNKPIRTTDANGNVTDYEYAAQHGGVTRVRGPAVGGVRPETRYSYGQYYAWTRAGSGSSFVRASTPVWLLSSERTCISSAMTSSGCAGGAADQVVTNYQYEAGNASKGSNLLLLGTAVTARNASGQTETLRTCYAYDDQGRRISETSPRANLSSCPS